MDQVDLRAQVSGYLTEIHVTDGQFVHKGDLLFVIDPRPYEIALQTAVAQLQTANASLDLANKQVARSTVLKRSDFESAEVVDQRTQLGRPPPPRWSRPRPRSGPPSSTWTSPASPPRSTAGRRSAGLARQPDQRRRRQRRARLSTIVSLDPIHVDFDMSEADALVYQRYLSTKQPVPDRTVKISLGDEIGWTRQGTLDFLDNQVDRSSGTLHARATVANADLLITPGQFARVQAAHVGAAAGAAGAGCGAGDGPVAQDGDDVPPPTARSCPSRSRSGR